MSGPAPGLYLHLPFCAAVCPYCDFAVVVGSAGYRERFVDSMLREIRTVETAGFGAPFDSVYLGGGTPSLFAAGQLERILGAARDRFPVAAGAAVTLEANPEDVTPASLAAWRELGITVLSLGVQSFDDEALAFLGRAHTARQGRRAVERALAAGFASVSLDLIYGLPDQTAEAARRDLARAVAAGPQHLSCYQLTVEPRTVFGHRSRQGELAELAEERKADLFFLVHRFLEDAGYPAYEVSNFACSAAHRSRHNGKYWEHVPYLGLGPSAHSFDGRRRWWNERKPGPYRLRLLAGERPVAGDEELSDRQLALERLMLALRTPEGLDLDDFRRRYGVDLAALNRPALERLEAEGLVELAADRLRPTRRGLAVADGLARALEVE